MRHIAVSAAVLLTAALTGHAAAQDRPAAYVNTEACLVQNVDAAVAASSGAADAAEFLLTYLCAGPVSAATAYETNSRLLASGRGIIDAFAAMVPEPSEAEMETWDESDPEEDDAWEPAEIPVEEDDVSITIIPPLTRA